MASQKTEDYLKAIYQCGQQVESAHVPSGAIAQQLDVTPSTATLMLQRLAEQGMVEYEAYRGVQLTARGLSVALNTIRCHRLVELFLVETLGLSWDVVHEEAERLEHTLSDELTDRIDEFLGMPAVDPHGDPIPRGGQEVAISNIPLDTCQCGATFVVLRVLDQSPEFLRYLSQGGVQIGSKGQVVEINETAGIVRFTIDGRQVALSQELARNLRVGVVATPSGQRP